jgi:hypothetical protein
MKRFRNLDQLRRLVPGAATVLTLSLAVTLRVERSCSEIPPEVSPSRLPAVLYPYAEILASLFSDKAIRFRLDGD